MFRDAKEELARLEEALLEEEAQEELEEEFLEEEPGEDPDVYVNYANDYGKSLRNYASGYKAYNTDTTDTDLESFSEEVYESKKEDLKGLWITALVLLIAIFGVLAWAFFRFGGVLE